MSTPTLARITGHFLEGPGEALTISGGLHFLRGNPRPYFSLTADVYTDGGKFLTGGACHALILQHRPDFADLAALHLADDLGRPLHALENGLYWLAGAAGGLGERYHGGTGSPPKSPEECRGILARHFRISPEDAEHLTRAVRGVHTLAGSRAAKDFLSGWIEGQRERWSAEAEACIQRHTLQVFGDPWTPPALTGGEEGTR